MTNSMSTSRFLRASLPMLTLALLASSALYAQVTPGYLGKKLAVSYRGTFFPAILHPTNSSIDGFSGSDFISDGKLQNDGIGLSFLHHLDLETVISPRSSLVIGLDFYRTFYGGNINFSFDPTLHYTSHPDFEPMGDFPSMLSTGASFGLRRYSDHFAPLGSYFQLSAGFDNINYSGFEYPVNNGQTIVVEGGRISALRINASWGTQRIINDYIVIGYGLDISYGFFSGGENQSFSRASLWDDYHVAEVPENADRGQRAVEEAVAQRALSKGLMNLSFTIGLLP